MGFQGNGKRNASQARADKFFNELTDDERTVITAVRNGGGIVPPLAVLARALQQRHSANIPAIIDSIKAKGRLFGCDFLRPREPAGQNVLPLARVERFRLPNAPYRRGGAA